MNSKQLGPDKPDPKKPKPDPAKKPPTAPPKPPKR
jgi:hypothetical protein